VLAQFERGNIVERTGSGQNTRGRQDGEKGGRLPYDYVHTLERNVAAAQQITDDTRND
jgi:DNA invertase Pin-like site-specific DNA recombinase